MSRDERVKVLKDLQKGILDDRYKRTFHFKKYKQYQKDLKNKEKSILYHIVEL